MITYIKGELTEVVDQYIVVEAYGVGYEIMVPASTLGELPPIGHELKIYTYQNVREDALDLFGFFSRDHLNIFKLLISVNGIGPKGALSILSSITPDDLRLAVITDDVKRIQSAPGIGSKTAQKLMIELKDKLHVEDVIFRQESGVGQPASIQIDDEVVEALVSLGYSYTESLKAVRSIEVTQTMDSELLLKQALKKLAFL